MKICTGLAREHNQAMTKDPAGRPNGLSSPLKSRGRQKPLPSSKRKGFVPKSDGKGPRSRQVSKQSAAWDKFTAVEPPEAQSAPVADVTAPHAVAPPHTEQLPDSRAAAELAGQDGKAFNAEGLEQPAHSEHATASGFGDSWRAEALQVGSKSGSKALAVDPACKSSGPRERESPSEQAEAEEQPLPSSDTQPAEQQLQAPGQLPASGAPVLPQRSLCLHQLAEQSLIRRTRASHGCFRLLQAHQEATTS